MNSVGHLFSPSHPGPSVSPLPTPHQGVTETGGSVITVILGFAVQLLVVLSHSLAVGLLHSCVFIADMGGSLLPQEPTSLLPSALQQAILVGIHPILIQVP